MTRRAASTAGGAIDSFEIYANGTQVGSGGRHPDGHGRRRTAPLHVHRQGMRRNGACSTEDGGVEDGQRLRTGRRAIGAVTDTSQTAGAVQLGRARRQRPRARCRPGTASTAAAGRTGPAAVAPSVVGNACAQSHTIEVQGRDGAGLEGPESSASAGSSAACPDAGRDGRQDGATPSAGARVSEYVRRSVLPVHRIEVRNFPGRRASHLPAVILGHHAGELHDRRTAAGGVNADWLVRVSRVGTCRHLLPAGGRSGPGSIAW